MTNESTAYAVGSQCLTANWLYQTLTSVYCVQGSKAVNRYGRHENRHWFTLRAHEPSRSPLTISVNRRASTEDLVLPNRTSLRAEEGTWGL